MSDLQKSIDAQMAPKEPLWRLYSHCFHLEVASLAWQCLSHDCSITRVIGGIQLQLPDLVKACLQDLPEKCMAR